MPKNANGKIDRAKLEKIYEKKQLFEKFAILLIYEKQK